MPAAAAAGRTRSTASSSKTLTARRLPPRALRLDQAQVEEVVDDLPEAIGFLHQALAEPLPHGRVGLREEGLREHLERADRSLQLVADVRDEVTAHAVDPMDLRDVVDEHRGTERSVVSDERNRLELEHHPRRAEQLQLTFRRVAGAGVVEQLGDGTGGDRIGVPRGAIALGRSIAEDLGALAVDDDDAVAQIDECGGKPIALGGGCFGLGSDLFELSVERLLAPRTQPNLPVM